MSTPTGGRCGRRHHSPEHQEQTPAGSRSIRKKGMTGQAHTLYHLKTAFRPASKKGQRSKNIIFTAMDTYHNLPVLFCFQGFLYPPPIPLSLPPFLLWAAYPPMDRIKESFVVDTVPSLSPADAALDQELNCLHQPKKHTKHHRKPRHRHGRELKRRDSSRRKAHRSKHVSCGELQTEAESVDDPTVPSSKKLKTKIPSKSSLRNIQRSTSDKSYRRPPPLQLEKKGSLGEGISTTRNSESEDDSVEDPDFQSTHFSSFHLLRPF